MAGIIEMPIPVLDPVLGLHPLKEGRVRIRGQYMKGGGFNALPDGPGHSALKDRLVILIHAKDKTAVNHDPQIMETLDGLAVIPVEVLVFALRPEIGGIERFKANEQAAQA